MKGNRAPNGSGLSLRPVTAQDRLRIRSWLARPGVATAWGDAASAEAKINLATSSEAALCRMIEQRAATIGYGHAVEIGLWAGPLPEILAPGTWELELLVASGQPRTPDQTPDQTQDQTEDQRQRQAQHRSQDQSQDRSEGTLAAEALALLAEEVFATTLAIACCGLVPITNEAVARAHERAQFRWRHVWNDPVLGPSWVMLRERPS
jgi:hypothetical protein